MAGSLQDQLLKAGVANKNQAKKVSIEKRKQKKQAPTALAAEKAARQAELEQARKAKAEKDRALNETRMAEQGRYDATDQFAGGGHQRDDDSQLFKT